MEVTHGRVIGCYVTEKKNAKINWTEFDNVCRSRGFSLVKINIQEDLETQGPFFAIIHKMTTVIVKASLGDVDSAAALKKVESYIKSHPEVIVLDPLDAVGVQLYRSRGYQIVQNIDFSGNKVFTPTFVELTSTDRDENLRCINEAGVSFPFVCKPLVSHGSDAHQMAIIFNEKGVADCRPPCVAQSFINHNAVLYKIFIVGDNFNVSKRPSLKNFSASDQSTIFFFTNDVSKPDSTSSLTVLDPEDAASAPTSNLDIQCLQLIVRTLRRKLGLTLFGVDVVIEHESGRYGIIDINIFPGYDGFPNFFQFLIDNILEEHASRNNCFMEKTEKPAEETTDLSGVRKCETPNYLGQLCITRTFSSSLNHGLPLNSVTPEKMCKPEYDQDDSGFDTGDSSDERKKKWCLNRGREGHVKKIACHNKDFPSPLKVSPHLDESCIGSRLGGV